MTLKDMGMPAG